MRVGLSIDGGGTRGILPALYLEEIENLSRRPIYQLFDYFGGTSIGGIVALGCVVPGEPGLPRYRASDFVDLFRKQGKTIFSLTHSSLQEFTYNKVGYSWEARFNPGPLETILSQKFGDVPLSVALKPIIVPAIQTHQSADYFFNSTLVNIWQHDFLMRDVARGTSAAPTYFPAAKIWSIETPNFPSTDLTLLDGGIWHNNPSEHVYAGMQTLHPGAQYSIVSLGTGFGPLGSLPENAGTLKLASPLINTLMRKNAQDIDERMKKRLDNRYLRVQIDLDEGIDLADASDGVRELLEIKSEEKLDDLEDITRFLLMNDDAWKDLGGRYPAAIGQ